MRSTRLLSSLLLSALPLSLLFLACNDSGQDKPGDDSVVDGDADTDSDADSDSDADTDSDSGTEPAFPYFEPFYVHLTAFFGYDPVSNAARWYRGDGVVISPNLVGTLYEASFVFSGNYAEDACGFTITDAETASYIDGEPWTVSQGSGTADHLGFVMPEGTFIVGDYSDASTGMPSCRSLAFDPARYGAGFPDWASTRQWGFGVGTLDPEQQALIETESSLSELAALLAAGQLVGGSFQTSDTARNGSMLMVGYPMDEAGNIESEVYLTADQMWPGAGSPAMGVYTAFLVDWIRADAYFGDP